MLKAHAARRLLAVGALLALVLATSRVVPLFAAPKARSVRVGTWKTAQTIAPYEYQRFLKGRYTVDVRPFTNPGDQKTALLAGSLDMCGTTMVMAITAASRGEPVVVVAALCDKCSALAVRKDSSIRKPADLRGKTIGYVPATMHDVLLRETLTRAGLNPLRDVKLTRIDFFDMGQALSTGAIDAFLSGEPFPTVAKVQGYGRILSYPYFDDSIGTINAGMIVTRKQIQQNPKLVQDLVTAHVLATEYYNAHRAQWLRSSSAFGTPLPVLQEAAKNIALTWKIDAKFIQQTRNLGKRMLALKMISREPDYDRMFDVRFLKEAQKALSARKKEWQSR